MDSFSSSIRRALPLLLAVPVAAQTLVVDVNNGPGTNFTSLATAIAAAPSGAVINVRAGVYNEPVFTISATSLTILGVPGVEVVLPASVPFRVEALGPTHQVVIERLRVRSAASTMLPIECLNNQGIVLLEALGNALDPFGLVATDCDWLVASDCSFVGAGVRCTNSSVVLERCGVSRGTGIAVVQTGGRVQLVEATMTGFPTFSSSVPATYLLQGGDVRVSADTVVSSGMSIMTNQLGPCFAGSGTARVDPRAVLTGANPIFPSTITTTMAAMPHVTTAEARLGFSTGAELHGPWGHLGALCIGFPGALAAIPAVADPVWFDPATVVTQAFGVPSAMQSLTTTTSIPAAPALQGIVLVWHGVTFDAVAGLQASNPSVRVVHP